MPTGLFPMADDEERASILASRAQLECKVESSLTLDTDTGAGDATYSHQATGVTLYAPDAVDLAGGIYLFCSSGFDGTDGSWTVTYDGPGAPFGGYTVSGTSYLSTVSVAAVMGNVRLYSMESGALHRIMWDTVSIYVNGSLSVVLPSSSFDSLSNGVGANYIPLLGIPLTVSNSCGAGRANVPTWTYNACAPDNADGYDHETAVTQTVTGGWRFQEGSTWFDLPVTPYSGTVPDPGDCPFGLGAPSIPAGRTWGDLLEGRSRTKSQFEYIGREYYSSLSETYCRGSLYESHTFTTQGIDPCTGLLGNAYRDTYKSTPDSESEGGSITLQPDLSRTLDRFRDLFAKLLYRADLPETRATLSHACTDTVGGVGSSATATSTPTVHTALSVFLGLVRDADHEVLDAFGPTVYAPCQASQSQNHVEAYIHHFATTICEGVLCPPPMMGDPEGFTGVVCTPLWTIYEDVNQIEVASLSFPTYVGSVANWQGHAEPLARYLGTWANPHWHLFDYKQDWELQGSNAPYAAVDPDPGYWGPIRQQLAYNSALPEGERPNTRLDMIASPYWDSAFTPVWDAYTGGMTPTGVSRWITREVTFPTSITLTADSEPMLSCPDGSCTVSIVGGNIEIVPLGPAPCVVDIDLARFDCYPYLALLVAKSVRFASYSNAAEVLASLRSALGGSKELNSGAHLGTGTDHAFPRGTDDGYSGTWGIDNGAGYVADEGTDVAPGGESSVAMSNPERMIGMQGLRGMAGSVLRLTVTPTDDEEDVLLSLPTFERPTTHPEVRWLTGSSAALFWPDGPGILWGTLDAYVHDEGLYNPPLPKPLGEPNSIADALFWIYAVCEATDPGDVAAYDAEVVAMYDDFEVSLENIGSADKFSLSFILPKGDGETMRFALVQTIGEVPPLSCWPTRERDTGTWLASGDHAMERWDQAQEVKYIVSPVLPLVLKNPGGTTLSTADTSVSGWAVQKYTLSLDGDEDDDYGLWQGDTKFATVYPWHGWYWIGQAAEEQGRVLALISRPDGRLYRLTSTDARVKFGRSSIGDYTSWLSEEIYDAATDGDLSRLNGERVAALLVVGGSALIGIVKGEGYEELTTMTDGSATAGCLVTRGDGSVYVFRIDGGTVKGTLRSGLDLSLVEGPWNTNLTGLSDDARIDADPVRLPGNVPGIVLSTHDGTVNTYVSSDGGKTFS